MLATGHPMENSLRWLRRSIVMILLVANLMTVILADAAATVTRPHIPTIEYSSIQANIHNIPAPFTSSEAESNALQWSITTP